MRLCVQVLGVYVSMYSRVAFSGIMFNCIRKPDMEKPFGATCPSFRCLYVHVFLRGFFWPCFDRYVGMFNCIRSPDMEKPF